MGQESTLLITGGAGYVGSHAVLAFLDGGYRVVVLDDLSTGSREAVPPAARFVEGDAGDAATVAAVIAENRVAAVVHLAASTGVADSCLHPARYHRNNALASANLIRACAANAVRRLVFASSAAVYGIPQSGPVSEEPPPAPVSPYGRSKLATERLLGAVAGAAGRRAGVTVFGTDYDTPDGTCLRDDIHVSDLAGIQVAALSALDTGAMNLVLNCGTGRGASVRDVIRTVRAEAGLRFDVRDGGRRAGDPPPLVADTARLRAALTWTPRHPGLAAARESKPHRIFSQAAGKHRAASFSAAPDDPAPNGAIAAWPATPAAARHACAPLKNPEPTPTGIVDEGGTREVADQDWGA